MVDEAATQQALIDEEDIPQWRPRPVTMGITVCSSSTSIIKIIMRIVAAAAIIMAIEITLPLMVTVVNIATPAIHTAAMGAHREWVLASIHPQRCIELTVDT